MSEPTEIFSADQPRNANQYLIVRVLRLWFGVSDRVSRTAYAVTGFGLMALKYAGEALAIGTLAGAAYRPQDFLNPLLMARAELLGNGPGWLPWALFLGSLPFLWIAVSMSVRRAADAGFSPWFGFLVLIPLVNLLFMVLMCVFPSTSIDAWERHSSPTENGRAQNAVFALVYALLIGGVMLGMSVYFFESYGASLFLGTPFLMGSAAAYFANRPSPRSVRASAGLGAASVIVAVMVMLLFALEGVICISMALPLIVPIGALGGILGKAIADATVRPKNEILAPMLVLPLIAFGESIWFLPQENVVLTIVEIDADPERVWPHVVSFPDLPAERPWYFDWGIACPERARIVGQGVGAVRHCEFSTGTFVEPITSWEKPSRLGFDVTDQPPPMRELSPYRHVHAPHLHGFLKSSRGEFRLIPLPQGRTRLEGRTWYTFRMSPQIYWTAWSDEIIHRIHQRVLEHIKHLAEDTVQECPGA